MRKRKEPVEFTSSMRKGETIAAVAYLPAHVFLIPFLLAVLLGNSGVNDAELNLLYYVVGVVYMLSLEWRFLRREFDTLCDGFLNCAVQICICYGLMIVLNICVNSLLLMLLPEENPNNSAIMDMAGGEYGKIAAMAVFLAPIVEELIFRAGIFGALRRKNRFLAYAISMLIFPIYHIWGYAVINPSYWIYMIQYIPVSYLLCRCYERTNTIWSSIFLHMVINGISIKVMTLLQELM